MLIADNKWKGGKDEWNEKRMNNYYFLCFYIFFLGMVAGGFRRNYTAAAYVWIFFQGPGAGGALQL